MNPDDNMNEDDDLEIELPAAKKFVHPDGDYAFVVVDCQRDVSSKGNPELIWDFRGPDELNNALFKSWTVLTPEAAWKVTEIATALNLAKEGEKIKISELRKNAIGRRFIGKLKKETYNGNERSVIKEFKPHPDGAGETRPADDSAPF